MPDETLQDLGPIPSDIDALIERYLGSRRITAAQADEMLQALQSGSAASSPSRTSSPPPDLRPRRRYNTPFPQGLAGAEDLPELSSGRGLRTPLPGFYPPVKPAVSLTPAPARGTPPPPSVFSPPSASAAWLPAPEESAVIPVARTPVPASLTPVPAAFPPDSVAPAAPEPSVFPAPASVFPPASDLSPAAASELVSRSSPPLAAAPSQPMAADAVNKEDSFEILVDDDVLELEADDLLIEDVTDEDDDV